MFWLSSIVVKNLPASAGDVRAVGSIPGGKEPLEECMATNSSIPDWRIPWIEEPDDLQSMGSQRVEHDYLDLALTHTHTAVSNKYQLFTLIITP